LRIQNVSDPIPVADQVLVEVCAASINPFDKALVSGKYKGKILLQFPFTVGGDFSGLVTETGDAVTEYKKGDEIFGTANALGAGSGSFAEKLIVKADKIALKPKNATFEESAAIVLVGVSALQGLKEHINLQRGQKILIHGGAGGVGHIAIQVAKDIGAFVSTTVSHIDMEYVKSLGADEAIDYKHKEFENILRGYDAVFDTVGGDITNKSFAVLREGGILVTMIGMQNEKEAQKYKVKTIRQVTDVNTLRLNKLAKIVEEGKVKIKISNSFPLQKAKEAFEYFNSGKGLGKVVLRI